MMSIRFSTLRLALSAVASVALLALGGGCASHRFDSRTVFYYRPSPPRPDPVMPDPAPDEAATARGWDVSTYHYPNGRTVAGPTYNLNYEDRPSWLANDYVYSAAQPGIVALDALAMPFWMIFDPPLKPMLYHGTLYPPSMTVAPPLPNR